MEIRDYTPEDLAPCLVLAAAHSSEFEAVASGGNSLVVAEHEGRIVGTAAWSYSGSVGRIDWLIVAEDCRRQGLGRFLLFHCLRAATRDAQLELVFTEVATGVAGFFEKQGFHVESSTGNRTRLRKRLAVCS